MIIPLLTDMIKDSELEDQNRVEIDPNATPIELPVLAKPESTGEVKLPMPIFLS